MTRMLDRVLIVAFAALAMTGCGDAPFDAGGAVGILQSKPIELDGEQVSLTTEQIMCGEREDLWVVFPLSEGRATGHLNDAARALGFSDDIHIGDPKVGAPWAQVRGKFPVVAGNGVLKEVDPKTKVLEARTMLVMNHPCLQNPGPALMGVHHGQFSTQDNPTFEFRQHGENWQFAQLVH